MSAVPNKEDQKPAPTPGPAARQDDAPVVNDDLGGPLAKIAWALLFAVILGLMGAALWQKSRISRDIEDGDTPKAGPAVVGNAPAELDVQGQVPDFMLTAQDGKPFAAQNLRGSVSVANFIFTRCAGTCTTITQAMILLNQELAGLPKVQLVSFSMDPEYDTPERLAAYAKANQIDSPRWHFITGPKAKMQSVTQEGFMLSMKEGLDPKEPVIHSSKFVLMDRRGQIRGYYSGLEPDGIMKLAKAVRTLEKSGE